LLARTRLQLHDREGCGGSPCRRGRFARVARRSGGR
jgi:hypothetical protein